MKNMIVIICLVVVCVGSVNGDTIIDKPIQLIGNGNLQDFMMTQFPVSYLMKMTGAGDFPIEKGDGQYHIFFCKYANGDPNLIDFGAYLSTDNSVSNQLPEYQAWCQGLANRNKFLENEGPDYVLVVYDDDGGRFALLNETTRWLEFDENIVFWESGGARFIPGSGDIGYDGNIDGLLDVNFGPIVGDTFWMDSIVLVPYSGPVLREGPYDINDLSDLVYYWLSECDGTSNDYCEGLDFDGDGFVNFMDFSHVASGWVLGASASSSSNVISHIGIRIK